MKLQRIGLGHYKVPSSDGTREYDTYISGSCDCPFGRHNRTPTRTCKHVEQARAAHNEDMAQRRYAGHTPQDPSYRNRSGSRQSLEDACDPYEFPPVHTTYGPSQEWVQLPLPID